MQLYFSFIEAEIKKLYNMLNEKNRRLYAAIEALKIGHGGISYIAKLVGCTRKTVAQGIRELQAPTAENHTDARVRLPGGGSNNCRHYLFKQDIQNLADKIGVEIRIAHYPPYTSKYNPIEHRLFPHVTRACQGVIFKSIEIVKELIGKTKTSTGLKVTVDIIDKVYGSMSNSVGKPGALR